MKTTILLSFIFCGRLLAGDTFEELRLTDGTILKNVEVKEVSAQGLKVTHENGSGVFSKKLLPPDVLKKFAADFETAEQEALEKAMVKRQAGEAKAAKDKADLAAQGISLEVFVAEGAGFFRYYLKATDLTGRQTGGKLTVRYETPDHPAGVNAKEVPIRFKERTGSAGVDWFTGPPVRHSKAGVINLQWVFKTPDGGRYEGTSKVPNKIWKVLPPDEKMEK
jgi:hypothetical protein